MKLKMGGSLSAHLRQDPCFLRDYGYGGQAERKEDESGQETSKHLSFSQKDPEG